MTKRKNALDKLIEETYYRHGYGVTIDLFSIPKIFAEGRAALAEGRDLDAAIIESIARYKVAS